MGLFAMLFVAVGAVALTGPDDVVIHVFVGIAFLVAAVLALAGWGVVTSVKTDLREQRLDRAIEQIVAARGVSTCGCGHEHDPSELHVVDEEPAAPGCAHDGAGADCAHDCQNCVLTAMRGSDRPAPRPRPRPSQRA